MKLSPYISKVFIYCHIIVEDDVYLESAAERDEYVLNQTGLIFRGTAKDPTPLNWNFAQVRKDMCNLWEFTGLYIKLLLSIEF